MCDEQVQFRERLNKANRRNYELNAELLRKEDTIRKLTAELKDLHSIAPSYVYDVMTENGMATAYRMQLDNEFLSRRRKRALEKHQIEYENRVGTSLENDSSKSNDEGFDEIDGLS